MKFLYPEVCFILFMLNNIFQNSFPRISDSWMANFNSQMQGCYEAVPRGVEGLGGAGLSPEVQQPSDDVPLPGLLL